MVALYIVSNTFKPIFLIVEIYNFSYWKHSVSAIVTTKERESDASDTLRNAKHPYMTNLGYVSYQSRRQLYLRIRQSTESVFGPFTYSWGPRDLFWQIIKIISGGRGLLLSSGIKECKAPGFREPIEASVSK